MKELIIIGVGVFIVLLLLGWIITTHNKIKTTKIKVNESFSGIDVALTQRFDLLSNLLNAVKGYVKHEKETLANIVGLRNLKANASIEEKQQFSKDMEKALTSINVIVEQYPNLKASEVVTNLQNTTLVVEENLQAARRIYNSNVAYYNKYIVVFPNSIIAKLMKAENLPFFEAEVVKRSNVELNY